MKSVFAIFITGLLLCCTGPAENEEVAVSEPGPKFKSIKIIQDIPYRDGESDSWKLDIAIPDNSKGKSLPTIVIIHGGGWRFGSKTHMVYRDLLVDYAFQGYVTASVEYRFVNEAPFPACVEDVKCAVRWLRAHAEEYHIDPERIGAYGHSAGAHLALMLAVSEGSPEFPGEGGYEEYSSGLQCVAAGSTPTEWNDRIKEWNNPLWWPVGYIKTDLPPMLLIHGAMDEIVNVDMVDRYKAMLDSVGFADVQYIRIDSGNHGVAYEYHLDITKPAMDKFFEENLKR